MQDRPLSAAPTLVTRRGAEFILAEIESLRARLETLTGTVADETLRDLRYWEARRVTMQIVERDPDTNAVGFGTEVVVWRAGQVAGSKNRVFLMG